MENYRGIVLAGGKSSRMGQDKALLPWGKKVLATWMVERVQVVCGSAFLVGSAAKYSGLGYPVIEDVFAGHGPLGGIHAGLQSSPARWNLVVGCDLPYLSVEFLTWMLQLATSEPSDVTIPESEAHGYEPLCAVYASSCLHPIEAALRSGRRKVSQALEGLEVRVVRVEEWKRYDPAGKLFRNVNTEEEYRRARAELLARERIVGGHSPTQDGRIGSR